MVDQNDEDENMGDECDRLHGYTDPLRDDQRSNETLNHSNHDANQNNRLTKSGKKRAKQQTTECGLVSWRPRRLQRCANLASFTAVLSFLSVFGAVNFSYFTAVISQIERLYGLPSSISGFIKNADNIGFMLSVLVFSHFCRHSNKPRLLAVTNVLAACAIWICVIPYFIYGSDSISHDDDTTWNNNTNNDNNPVITNSTHWESHSGGRDAYQLCDPARQEFGNSTCGSRRRDGRFNPGALAIFLCATLFQGMMRSPQATLSLTYIDDTSPDSAPKYFGFMFGSRSLAPVLGFLLGAWTSSIHVDLSDPGFGPKDPRWVGAWWIGYLICGLVTLVWSLPLLCFPAQIQVRSKVNKHVAKGPASKNKDGKKKGLLTEKEDDAELPGAPMVWKELTEVNGSVALSAILDARNGHSNNDIQCAKDGYLTSDSSVINGRVICANGSFLAVEAGPGVTEDEDIPDSTSEDDFAANLKDMPRALVRLFRKPVFSLLILGACCNITMLGYVTFLPKYLETHFGQSPSMANIYTGCISALCWSLGPIISGRVLSRWRLSVRRMLQYIVGIQVVAVSGFLIMMFLPCPDVRWGDSILGTLPSANESVRCADPCGCDPSRFTPVCGEDGQNYFSPCAAGCTSVLSEGVFADCRCVGPEGAGRVDVGRCSTGCPLLASYLVTLGVTSLITSMFPVPMMAILLRCGDRNDRALSLALATGVVNFAAFPAPVLYGLVIDSTCLVYQSTCEAAQGACLWYNPTDMRWRFHGLASGFKVTALILYLMAYYFGRNGYEDENAILSIDVSPKEAGERDSLHSARGQPCDTDNDDNVSPITKNELFVSQP